MSSISAITASSIISAAKSRSKKSPAVRLYECTYHCGHLWTSSLDSWSVKCPNCASSSNRLIANEINPNLHFVKMQAATFAGKRFYHRSDLEKHPNDLFLDTLASQGFFLSSHWTNGEAIFHNALHEVAIFQFSKSRKTTVVFVGLHHATDPLFQQLAECAKQDRKNKKNEPPPPPKPKFASIKDALGRDACVGDWVCAWGTSSLSFGQIISIEKFKENDYDRDSEAKMGARVRKGKTILPFKTSEQIFLLTPEQSLVLALEQ